MKIVARPIDAIVVFQQGTHPVPHKFKFRDTDGTIKYVRVEQIFQSKTGSSGNMENILYVCQSHIDGQVRRYELKYFLKDARWELYKL